jgi:hypothetical protein
MGQYRRFSKNLASIRFQVLHYNTTMPKLKDAVDLNPDSPIPPGYHWFGDKPIFNPETSSATVAIVRFLGP